MSRTLLLSCLTLLLGTLALGCGKKTEDASKSDATIAVEPTPAAPPAPAVEPVVTAVPARPLTITLIKPGAAPLKPLRYMLTAGKTQIDAVIGMSMQMKLQGNDLPPAPVPGMTLGFLITVAEKTDPDSTNYEFEINAAGIDPKSDIPASVQENLKQAFQSMIGLSGSAVVDTRGQNREASVKLPPNMPPSMAQAMSGALRSVEQLSSPFPDEPVGVGAQWKVVQNTNQGGIELEQVGIYTLKSLTAEGGVLDLAVSQSAKPQVVNAAGMPAGSSAELATLKSEGKGELTFRFDSLAPTSSTLELTSDSTIKVTAEGTTQDISTKAQVKVAFKSKPVP